MESFSDTDSSEGPSWIEMFTSYKGHEFFCEVEKEYILDRFNLTGLASEVMQNYQGALDLICDRTDFSRMSETDHAEINNSAFLLYGLIHARYIITSRGLQKMCEKYKRGEFGRCARVLCRNQHLLPVGMSDHPKMAGVKLYCPNCEDIYNPRVGRHETIDGAFFGTTFPHLFFQTFPDLFPTNRTLEKYIPRIFGFKIHGFPGSAASIEANSNKPNSVLNDGI